LKKGSPFKNSAFQNIWDNIKVLETVALIIETKEARFSLSKIKQ
jgi:hypothetical protein